MSSKTHICPWWLNCFIDNPFRRIFSPSRDLLQNYLSEGMTFLDIGCGGGRFSVEAAKIVGESGRVISLDIQSKMLRILEKKVAGSRLESIIHTHLVKKNNFDLTVRADFALAMFMTHEVPDCDNFFKQVKSVLRTDAKLLVVEPKGHVSKDKFKAEIISAENAGFKVIEYPHLGFICRAFLVKA